MFSVLADTLFIILAIFKLLPVNALNLDQPKILLCSKVFES